MFNDDEYNRSVRVNYTNIANESYKNIFTNLFNAFYDSAKNYTYIKYTFIYLNPVAGLYQRMVHNYISSASIPDMNFRGYMVSNSTGGVLIQTLDHEFPTHTSLLVRISISSNGSVTYTNITNDTLAARNTHSIFYIIIRR